MRIVWKAVGVNNLICLVLVDGDINAKIMSNMVDP